MSLNLRYVKESSKGRGEQMIDKVYENYLKFFTKYLGNKATYDYELDQIAKLLWGDRFVGTYSIEEFNDLPKLKNKQMAIGNTGDHWVSLYMNKDKLVIYDSFGRHYQELFHRVLSNKYPKIENTDNDAEQLVKEEDCGPRSLAWLATVDSLGIDKALQI